MLVAIAFIFVFTNGLACMHARAFTHYDATAEKEKDAEDLSWKEKARYLLTGVAQRRPGNKKKPWFWTRYSTHTFESTDGVTLEAWYIPTRNARAVVAMFHGYGTAKASLLDEEKAFRDLGYSTFLVDFRGHGGSSGSVTTIGYREADDVAATVDYLHELLPDTPIVLYGSSMGAAAVLRAMAIEGVKPVAAVLECPFDTLLSAIKNRFDMMHVPSFPAAYMLVLWGGLQFGYNGFAHNPTDYARDVTVPVLLIGGAKDRRVTRPQLESTYANLAGTKKLLIFEDSGHGGYVDDDIRRWSKGVRDLLDSALAEKDEAAPREEAAAAR